VSVPETGADLFFCARIGGIRYSSALNIFEAVLAVLTAGATEGKRPEHAMPGANLKFGKGN
jgi:hypothetical protein